MWRDYHNTEYALEDGTLYLKVTYPEVGFAPPRGKEISKEPFDRIIEHCIANNEPARIFFASEKVLEHILEMFPNARTQTDRNNSDYLYLSEDLINLSGRRYSGQRNHINHFIREYPEWSFEQVTGDNLGVVRAFLEENARENVKDLPIYIEGNKKALEVLDNLELYSQFGGMLTVGGEVIGASFGEIVDDTLFIHTEKADTAYPGSYPMLMNQFAKRFVTGDIEYINREDDDGDEGLRISKLSYHPSDILDKYTVEIQ